MVRLPGDDRKRKHGVIPDKKVRSWVCSINPEKVRQDIREQLIAFQDECDSILVDYWTKGVAFNPRHNLQLNDNLKHFIAETVGTSIREAMRELAVALRETFVTKDTFQGFTDQYERRLTALEQDRGVATLEIPTSAQISVEQAQMLRKLVKEKGGSRKGICHIWKKFRQKFQVESYHRLPNCKFQDALRWVNSL